MSPSPPPPPPAAKPSPPPPPGVPAQGLSYTLLRGTWPNDFPAHQGARALEKGYLTAARLGTGYACQPLLPVATPQPSCLSTKYKTQFAVRASGKLRVTAADVKTGKAVQLLLTATGSARVTVNGQVIATLTISGAPSKARWLQHTVSWTAPQVALSVVGTPLPWGTSACSLRGLCFGPASLTRQLPLPAPCLPPPADAATATVKSAVIPGVTTAGDHAIVVEWRQTGNGNSKLALLWKVGLRSRQGLAALQYDIPTRMLRAATQCRAADQHRPAVCCLQTTSSLLLSAPRLVPDPLPSP